MHSFFDSWISYKIQVTLRLYSPLIHYSSPFSLKTRICGGCTITSIIRFATCYIITCSDEVVHNKVRTNYYVILKDKIKKSIRINFDYTHYFSEIKPFYLKKTLQASFIPDFNSTLDYFRFIFSSPLHRSVYIY